jgi:hypothetical protein
MQKLRQCSHHELTDCTHMCAKTHLTWRALVTHGEIHLGKPADVGIHPGMDAREAPSDKMRGHGSVIELGRFAVRQFFMRPTVHAASTQRSTFDSLRNSQILACRFGNPERKCSLSVPEKPSNRALSRSLSSRCMQTQRGRLRSEKSSMIQDSPIIRLSKRIQYTEYFSPEILSGKPSLCNEKKRF